MKNNTGKIKSYILFILIITAFIQTGILWSKNTQRISFNYVRNIFKEYVVAESQSDTEAIRKYLIPYKLFIKLSDGYYVVNENDEIHREVFEETIKQIRICIEEGQMVKSEPEEWQKSIGRRGIYMSYADNIPASLFYKAFNINDRKPDSGEIEKIAVLYKTDETQKGISLFIKSKDNLWTCELKKNPGFERLFSVIKDKERTSHYITRYNGTLKDLFKNLVSDFGEPDIIYDDSNSIKKSYPVYELEPLALTSNNTLMDIILENKTHLYAESIDDKYIEYINPRNFYKFYIDEESMGRIEYRYIGENSNIKPDIFSSFKKCTQILDDINRFEKDSIKYRLLNIEETEKGYIINFSYSLNGNRLIIKENINEKCTFEIEGGNILRFDITTLKHNKIGENPYTINHQSLFNTNIKSKNWYINNIEVMYVFSDIKNLTIPKWMVSYNNDFISYYNIQSGDD
jgi:hypothetical protein